MSLRFQLPGHLLQGLRADLLGPVFESARRPLLVTWVPLRHMAGFSGRAGRVFAGMGGDYALAEMQADQ